MVPRRPDEAERPAEIAVEDGVRRSENAARGAQSSVEGARHDVSVRIEQLAASARCRLHLRDEFAAVDQRQIVLRGVTSQQLIEAAEHAGRLQVRHDRPQPPGGFRVAGGVMLQVDRVVDVTGGTHGAMLSERKSPV